MVVDATLQDEFFKKISSQLQSIDQFFKKEESRLQFTLSEVEDKVSWRSMIYMCVDTYIVYSPMSSLLTGVFSRQRLYIGMDQHTYQP